MNEIHSQERNRDPLMLTWFRLVRVLKKIIRVMDKPIETLNLSRYQFELLMQVALEPGINQQTCADRMNVTKGNITQHLDKLEALSLIQRNKAGRESSLQLSQKGEKMVAEFIPLHDKRVREIFSTLAFEEVQQFQAILRKLDRSLN